MKKLRRDLPQYGFSLVEIMVAVGLVGGLALIVMTLTKDTVVSTKRLEAASEIITLHNGITQILLNETACSNTLGGLDTSSAVPVSSIRNALDNVMFSSGAIYGNNQIRIAGMSAALIGGTKEAIASEPGFSRANIRLQVTYEKISQVLTGPGTISRDIIVSAKVNTSTDAIINCYSTEGDAIQEALRKACESIEGTYIPTDESCDLKAYGVSAVDQKSRALSEDFFNTWLQIPAPAYEIVFGNDTDSDLVTFSSRLRLRGNVLVENNSTIEMTSDRKLKKNIHTLDNVLERLSLMRGVEFQWKKSGKHDIGFIAQEVQQAFPEMVGKHPDFLSVKYPQMSAVAIQAVKELHQENLELKKSNKELKQQVEHMNLRLNKMVENLCVENPSLKICE